MFAVLAQSVPAKYGRSSGAAPTDRWRFNRDRIVTGVAGSFNSHMREGRSSRQFVSVFRVLKNVRPN